MEHVLGVLSMIFWALIIVVAVKYVLLIMRATTKAKAAFSPCWPGLEAARGERSRAFLSCSPSAARRCSTRQYDHAGNFRTQRRGSIGIATPVLSQFVLPLTVAVLLALFLFQKGAPNASVASSAR